MKVKYTNIHGECYPLEAFRIDSIINEDTGIACLKGYNKDNFLIAFAANVVQFEYEHLD